MAATVATIEVREGDVVAPGQTVLILESMKMEHLVTAPVGGTVRHINVGVGDTVADGAVLLELTPDALITSTAVEAEAVDLDAVRPDLAEALARTATGFDAARPEAVARRHGRGQRTARENVGALVDEGSFVEYGALAVAAQRRVRSEDDLIRSTPADGLITGVGTVDGHRCMVIAYDYTVLAGTQGSMNHKKLDRMLGLAAEWRLPIVLFAEGGGGRPSDTDAAVVAGLDTPSFASFAALSGQVPLIGIVSGFCFAGNAALLGCCDVVIATEGTSIGMGGPVMIEGGGLGVVAPQDVGPTDVMVANGVIDVLVADEVEAVNVARQYLGYLHGPRTEWSADDPRHLRHVVPENRLRSYDMRSAVAVLADHDSVLELRPGFGIGIITAFVRVEGRPFGVFANNPRHLGGAIDADAGDKAARFLQLCDSYDLPVIALCDTPGFMVGPEAERDATVRHVSRMFVVSAALHVPVFTVVLRKGYGLGAQAMAAGSFHSPFFIVAWPSGEFGGMGLEGAVRLTFRKELESMDDEEARDARFRELVDHAYERGKALNMASFLEIDAVIDPADTRRWLLRGLASVPPRERRPRRRRFVDPW
jgi:acetyl-CoA carboxylase carboxyltransferase component